MFTKCQFMVISYFQILVNKDLSYGGNFICRLFLTFMKDDWRNMGGENHSHSGEMTNERWVTCKVNRCSCCNKCSFFSRLHHFSDRVYFWNKQNEKTMNCGGGSSVRVNPIGIIFMLIIFVIIVYFNLGSSDSRSSLLNDRVTTEAVSLKALLSVSIEMARRGGVEVKRIREQVRVYFCWH